MMQLFSSSKTAGNMALVSSPAKRPNPSVDMDIVSSVLSGKIPHRIAPKVLGNNTPVHVEEVQDDGDGVTGPKFMSTYHEGRTAEEQKQISKEWTQQLIFKSALIPVKNLKPGTQSRYSLSTVAVTLC